MIIVLGLMLYVDFLCFQRHVSAAFAYSDKLQIKKENDRHLLGEEERSTLKIMRKNCDA